MVQRRRVSHLALAAVLVVSFPALGTAGDYETDQPLLVVANPSPGSSVSAFSVGDVDGDGRSDLVVSIAHPDPDGPGGPTPGTGEIRILRQREGGFEFAITTQLDCVPMRPILLDVSADAGREVVFPCATDSYALVARELAVLDMAADGSVQLLPRLRDDRLGSTPLTVLDADQDGREDLFYTYADDDNTSLDIEYRASLLYNRPGGFESWHGRRFTYSGIGWQQGVQPVNPQFERLDLDGDGTLDALQGRCALACAFLQQPGRQLAMRPLLPAGQDFANPSYGDVDGDGLPDRIQSDWGTQAAWLQLQVDPLGFEDVGSIGPISLPGPATIADLDLNGLADISLASERDLIVFLQQSPGSFANASQGLLNKLGSALVVEDVTGDLCPDLLSLVGTTDGTAFFQLFRGLRCPQASNLAVGIAWGPSGVHVTVHHAAGQRTFQDVVLRVNIAASMTDDRSLGLEILAPVGCSPVPAEAPRHLFDCVIGTLPPAGSSLLRFSVRPTKWLTDTVPMQAIAFLRDGSGDGNSIDNRAFAASLRGKRMTATRAVPRRQWLQRERMP